MQTQPSTPGYSRRQWLQALGSGLALGLGAAHTPRVWAQAAPQGAKPQAQGRLVVVFLRGAYDGLSAFGP